MACIADANVLFPLLVRGHVAHASAWRWWAQQADASVGLCLVVRLAVLRLLTNRTAMQGMPVAPIVALAAWKQLADDPRCFLVDAEPATHEKNFVRRVTGREATSNLWTDAWLAALAESQGHELVTFDRGFLSFDGLPLRLLSGERLIDPASP